MANLGMTLPDLLSKDEQSLESAGCYLHLAVTLIL
jgi:hypothetical protein